MSKEGWQNGLEDLPVNDELLYDHLEAEGRRDIKSVEGPAKPEVVAARLTKLADLAQKLKEEAKEIA